jgi:sigma-B regulation protein RsbU (phosphoserine phosphatase)
VRFRKQQKNNLSEEAMSFRPEAYFDFDAGDFATYLRKIIHEWSKTVVILVFILVPVFFILDYFAVPQNLQSTFASYRFACASIAIGQYLVLRSSKPSVFSYIHGYLVSLLVGSTIALMTVYLGGFDSSYYAGLNLVIIGVNLLLPWGVIHSGINSAIVIALYVALNALADHTYEARILVNNLFFLSSTATLAVIITYVRQKLVKQEFFLLVELKKARDALWSEVELARRMQTSLLPGTGKKMNGFEVVAKMAPAKEVGGDYYDIIDIDGDCAWVTVGDVSGHGFDSGLVMMMAQTSMLSVINKAPDARPSQVLESVNKVIRENVSRLGSDHYMTASVLRLKGSSMAIAGKHQDVILYRAALDRTEVIPTEGTWLGLSDDISAEVPERQVELDEGDIIVLFTDGVTEAMNGEGVLFGQSRLEETLNRYADLAPGRLLDKIFEEVSRFQEEQMDDMTLVVIKKLFKESQTSPA